MTRNLLVVTAVVLALGCSLSALGAPNAEEPVSWGDFQKSTDSRDRAVVAWVLKQDARNDLFAICVRWGREARQQKKARTAAAIREYLLHRNLINGLDLENARQARVRLGMTMCGVFAAYGDPDRSNRSQNVYGTRYQLVYENGERYVYIEAPPGDYLGLVVSISD